MAFVSLSAIVPRASHTPACCTRLTRREALRAAGTGLAARLFVVRASAAEVVTQTDVTVGTGKDVAQGATLKVHYTLTLDGWEGEPGAKVVDSSRSRGRPFRYNYGVGQVIKGWDQGVTGMKVGGRRKLVIPASLGYGDRGAGGVIPPGATLYFDIELLGVNS